MKFGVRVLGLNGARRRRRILDGLDARARRAVLSSLSRHPTPNGGHDPNDESSRPGLVARHLRRRRNAARTR